MKASVFASREGSWAADAYTAADQRVVLCLIPERVLEVHVTRSTGADAPGVDVVLRSLDWFGIRYHIYSDERGIATFRHLRAFQKRDGLQPAEVTVQAPFDKRPLLQFDSVVDMPSRVELVLPVCGALEVELLDWDGAPVESECIFKVELANADWSEATHTAERRFTPTGRTRFENVGVGLELVVSGSIRGQWDTAKDRVRGPEREGQTTQLILRFQPEPAAGFRAVDERGTVLAQHTLRGSAQDRDPSGDFDEPFDLWERVTDEAGRFPLEFPNSASEAGNRRRFELLTTRRSDGVVLHGRVELEPLGEVEEFERGDVQFRPAELLAAGRISDERGVPVAGAQVFLRPSDPEADPSSDEEPAMHCAHVISDANGDFEVRGQLDAPLITIIASRPGQDGIGEPIEVRKGASGVQLCLPRRRHSRPAWRRRSTRSPPTPPHTADMRDTGRTSSSRRTFNRA
jgi:hypothetical protein